MSAAWAVLRPALAGAAATLAGIGLARFAYVPLFPAMVAAGWVDGGGAGLLGAANLVGYLLGALGGRTLAGRLGTARALDLGMGAAALAFAACAWNGGLLYLALWRALAGVAGGVLMALAGPAVQAAVDPFQRGKAGGIVVTGVGSGVVLASAAVPFALRWSLPVAWIGLAVLVVALWAFAHPRWPDVPLAIKPTPADAPRPAYRPGLLFLTYGLSGAGMVAPMVYLADLAIRGRGLSASTGALVWLLFGVGAAAGTLAGGHASDRWGAVAALRAWLALQATALALALAPIDMALGAAGFLGGFAGVGITAVALARARELAGLGASAIWARATAVYAVSQALTAFALAALFARTGSHAPLFTAGLALSLAALALSVAQRTRLQAPRGAPPA